MIEATTQNYLYFKTNDPSHFNNKGKIVKIYAGSCLNPSEEALSNANFFVGLDNRVLSDRELFVPVHRLFHIEDNSVPENIEEFKTFIAYLCELIVKGDKLHIGCIGGKGRTGLVLAAIVETLKGEAIQKMGISSIDYVRLVYSEEAIENEEQEEFLQKHFNITKPRSRI